MGSNAGHDKGQVDSRNLASPSSRAPAVQASGDLDQPAGLGRSPDQKSSLPKEQGLQEVQLRPLQAADFEVDFSLPPPHPTGSPGITRDQAIKRDAPQAHQSVELKAPGNLLKLASAFKAPATAQASASPFSFSNQAANCASNSSSGGTDVLLGTSEQSGSTTAPASGPGSAEKQQSEVQTGSNSSLQPATPPLQTPAGQTPSSRPASEQEGDTAPAGPPSQGRLQGIAKDIQAAIERKLSVGVFRRHPPEDMEDAVPRLRSVAAEIETPGASPRSAATSPSSDPHHSGDSFTQAFMHQARRLRSAVLNQKVNFTDVAHNPRLARAARAELDGRPPTSNAFTHSSGASSARPHDAEVERQRAVLLAVDTEAEEESTINRELANVMCARLDAARRATERLLGVLQACANAEAAYTRTLTAASKVKLVGDCDGASVRGALDGFSDLPFMVGQAHVIIGAGLSDTTKSMQDMVSTLRVACADISGESAKVHKAIDSSRRGLHSAFVDHQSTCRIRDDSALERAKGRAARPFLEAADPWLTEARVVAAHGALHKAQAVERNFLTRAFTTVKDLELQRIVAIKDVIAAFAEAYRWGLSAVKADTAPLLRSAEQVDGEADLEELTASSEAAAETGATLAIRQADALEAASQELLCSPEVTRQGEMARWVSGSGKWMDCHCVLTRCGFLHWFSGSPPDPAEIVPVDSLNLSRCQFETGEAQAQEFNLIEVAAGMFGRSRRLIFKASSMEECCEWAIVLREAIAEFSKK